MGNKKEDKDFFLKRAELSGYKSIKDVKVDFDKGLNIIIGKNAAGKTNFLSFLDSVLDFSYNKLLLFRSKLSFKSNEEFEIESYHNVDIDTILGKPGKKNVLSVNPFNDKSILSLRIGQEKKSTIILEGKLNKILTSKNNNYTKTLIQHGIPDQFGLINTSLSFKIGVSGFSLNLINLFNDKRLPKFYTGFLGKLIVLTYGLGDKGSINEKLLIESIKLAFDKVLLQKEIVIEHSPIEDFRLSENLNVFYDFKRKEFTVTNLFVEFKIEGSWHPFGDLSDGTKRLFYLIMEIGYDIPESMFFDTEEKSEVDNDRQIVLLEEPELGIHPHQLMDLMDFIKEQSRTKQIIITTHSPLVLDILERDELHKIIIAENSENGTQMRHLSEEEIKKAEFFMKEEAYLSDYWKYFDLEK